MTALLALPRTTAVLLLLVFFSALAQAASPQWIEVRSAHFRIVTDGGERRGRHVADEFERMRWVFKTLFPKANVDPVGPIVVIAVRDGKDFQPLEPAEYLGRGKLTLGGYFLRAPDKNYVLLRLDAEGEHPYATVYHEYTHLQLGDVIEWMPLWLNEGLAQFFENTEIEEKEARLGEPNGDQLVYLRSNQPIPLTTLFAVDAQSPYYHEEQKGSIFYAESWALTHYLETTDAQQKTNRVGDYLQRVSRHEDPVVAAREAFGDLKQLENNLGKYTHRALYQYFRLSISEASAGEGTVTVTPLTQARADAYRADLMAYNRRTQEAQTLLDTVLEADPKNVLAHETKGYLSFQQGDEGAAQKWYGQAVALDSESYIAQYYFAMLAMANGGSLEETEKSLRAAIRLNPRFAPAYDGLAHLEIVEADNPPAAQKLELQAIQLEPGNTEYRIRAAEILMTEQKPEDAVRVLKAAEALAKSPDQAAMIQRRIAEVEQIEQRREQARQHAAAAAASILTSARAVPGPSHTRILSTGQAVADPGTGPVVVEEKPKHPTETPHGTMETAQGVIRDVRCGYPAVIEFTVESAGRKVRLYNNNYYKIDYSATNFTPQGDIHPCEQLKDMKARVSYFRTSDSTVDGQVVGIEMSR